jgi:transcriptional regulator with XRE-family HTH domain
MRTKKVGPYEFDIGHRVRTMRLLRRMSQSDLGKHLGITFQQIQKYEKNTNRISAGRLQRIAEIFDVSVSYFFGATDGNSVETTKIMNFLDNRYSLRLLQAFSGIENRAAQLALVALTEQLAKRQ